MLQGFFMIKVEHLTTQHGSQAVGRIKVISPGCTLFISYNRTIARITYCGLELCKHYSTNKMTLKYLYQFLKSCGMNHDRKSILAGIKNNSIKVVEL